MLILFFAISNYQRLLFVCLFVGWLVGCLFVFLGIVEGTSRVAFFGRSETPVWSKRSTCFSVGLVSDGMGGIKALS